MYYATVAEISDIRARSYRRMSNRSNEGLACPTGAEHHGLMNENDFTHRSDTGIPGTHLRESPRPSPRDARSRLRHDAAVVEAEIRRLRSTARRARPSVIAPQDDA